MKGIVDNGSTLTRRGYAMESINQFLNNVQIVIAVKSGKGYKVIAKMQDGSEVVLKKSGNLKAFVNVFDFRANWNASMGTAAEHCTFNNKAGVKTKTWDGRRATPIASFQITEAA